MRMTKPSSPGIKRMNTYEIKLGKRHLKVRDFNAHIAMNNYDRMRMTNQHQRNLKDDKIITTIKKNFNIQL